VQLNDGAALAHLGHPDMRVPISYALHYPERSEVPVRPLDLAAVGSLTFERPDTNAFPCLALAREAGERGGSAPCTLNAANEVAVQAFLSHRLAFLDVARVIEGTLEAAGDAPVHSFDDLYEADARARDEAEELVGRLAVNA
jgi:1-deoxy-D-xylulose-5-phosphate reductoisomerase